MENIIPKSLSVVVPAHNEQEAIGNVLADLKKELAELNLEHEIIVVNDASTDQTKEIVEKIDGVKLINHFFCKGYGGALKTGIKNSTKEYVLFFDADGQHKAQYIKKLLKHVPQYDIVIGARQKGYRGPLMRIPGKKILYCLANYLTGQKIPDLNSGFRLMKKNQIEKFLHLMPNSFSFSTTSTLIFLKEGLDAKFIPIEATKRIGKSTVRARDGFRMFLLILRTIILFSPLKVFLPASFFLFVVGTILLVQNLIYKNISDITLLFLISGLLIFFFGLLADQLSAIRREIRK